MVFLQVFIMAAVSTLAVGSLMPEPIHHAPQPYKFGYNVKDKHGDQYREEVGDGASGVKGSYGFTDSRGVHRRVDYVADHAGYRAQVKTNEPGTANQDPAAVKMISSAPYAEHEDGLYAGPGLIGSGLSGYGVGFGNEGLGYEGLGYGGLGHKGRGYGELGYEGLGHKGLGYRELAYGKHGYAGIPYAGLGYGLGNRLLGGLGYSRYGY